MIQAGDFRNGVTIEMDGEIFSIIEFQHVKPGKGAAFVRVKIKNIISGGTIERTFRPNERFPRAHIDRQDMQYLYKDDDIFYFMDTNTFDQIPVDASDVSNSLRFVKENQVVKILSHNGKVFGIEPPINVELEVTQADPAVKGDTATGAVKNVTLETGAVVSVPLFIEVGEILKIDTRTGEYISRA